MSSSKRNRILLISNSELGQANVFLAVTHELLRLDSTLEIHFCSFPPFFKLLSSFKSKAEIIFHELAGTTWKDALFNRPEHRFQELCDLRPTVWNAGEAAKMMPRVACPWNPEELCSIVQQVESVVQSVEADLVIVDNLMAPAVTVCYKLKPKWMILSPNTYKEFILGNQPNLQALWKFPPPRSTILYPVPFYLIPSTAYQIVRYVLNAHNPWIVNHATYMFETINTEYSDWGRISFAPPSGLKILLPSRPEVEFPFSNIPNHIVSCGPIVLPAPPLQEVDPELSTWLTKRPTVYVNLGTHASYGESDSLELANALKYLLEESKSRGEELQILWKLKKREIGGTAGYAAILSTLGPEWESNVRITDWLIAEPISILKSGGILCSINHGGANSYFEAVSAGIPQVVLPVWYDTYDFAQRVEWLGIGRFGSVNSAPRCSSEELKPILKQVLWGKAAEEIQRKARELSETCSAGGEGRVRAAKEILGELEGIQ